MPLSVDASNADPDSVLAQANYMATLPARWAKSNRRAAAVEALQEEKGQPESKTLTEYETTLKNDPDFAPGDENAKPNRLSEGSLG